jgi:hypothetical protein
MEPWDDDVFADFEEAGRVILNAQQRRELQSQVEAYVALLEWLELVGGDGAPHSRKWLDRLIKKLEATILALEAPSGVKGRVFSRAKLTLYVHNVAWWLKSLRDGCVKEREELGQQGRKPNFRLHELLGGLEFIFRDAGGIVKGISRSDEHGTREAPFIDFAWEVLLQVPESMRPKTHQALAVAWERSRQKPKP